MIVTTDSILKPICHGFMALSLMLCTPVAELQSNLSTMVKLLINNVKTLSKEIKRQKVSKGHEQKIVCKKCYINITFRDSLEDVYETWLILCNKKKC